MENINYIWVGVSLFIALSLKYKYKLNLWKYLCIAVPLIVIGKAIIRIFLN